MTYPDFSSKPLDSRVLGFGKDAIRRRGFRAMLRVFVSEAAMKKAVHEAIQDCRSPDELKHAARVMELIAEDEYRVLRLIAAQIATSTGLDADAVLLKLLLHLLLAINPTQSH